eukprot:scaffold198553_cov40-Tisochrysis_lutea.AAC.1
MACIFIERIVSDKWRCLCQSERVTEIPSSAVECSVTKRIYPHRCIPARQCGTRASCNRGTACECRRPQASLMSVRSHRTCSDAPRREYDARPPRRAAGSSPRAEGASSAASCYAEDAPPAHGTQQGRAMHHLLSPPAHEQSLHVGRVE